MPLVADVVMADQQTAPQGALMVELRIRNTGDVAQTILNADMGGPGPASKWTSSKEAYETSVLMSFGYLTMKVHEADGKELSQEILPTFGTPVLHEPIKLAPGTSYSVLVPIGSFYHLEPGKTYKVDLKYGDTSLKVAATGTVTAR